MIFVLFDLVDFTSLSPTKPSLPSTLPHDAGGGLAWWRRARVKIRSRKVVFCNFLPTIYCKIFEWLIDYVLTFVTSNLNVGFKQAVMLWDILLHFNYIFLLFFWHIWLEYAIFGLNSQLKTPAPDQVTGDRSSSDDRTIVIPEGNKGVHMRYEVWGIV